MKRRHDYQLNPFVPRVPKSPYFPTSRHSLTLSLYRSFLSVRDHHLCPHWLFLHDQNLFPFPPPSCQLPRIQHLSNSSSLIMCTRIQLSAAMLTLAVRLRVHQAGTRLTPASPASRRVYQVSVRLAHHSHQHPRLNRVPIRLRIKLVLHHRRRPPVSHFHQHNNLA